MNRFEYVYYNEKLLSAFAYHILFVKSLEHKKITIILDELIDKEKVKNIFLEINKSFCYVLKVPFRKNLYFIFSENNRISFDSIKNFFDILEKKDLEDFCVLVDRNLLSQKFPAEVHILSFCKQQVINFESFIKTIIDFGYKRTNYVEAIGDFSVRGEIIDIWSNCLIYDKESKIIAESLPVRIILEEDTIKDIKHFDITSQRSLSFFNIEKVNVYPVNFENIEKQLDFTKFLFKDSFIVELIEDNKDIISNFNKEYIPSTRYFGNFELFKKDLEKYINENYNIIIGYIYEHEHERIKSVLSSFLSNINLCKIEITCGFINLRQKIFFTTYTEIFTKFDYYHYYKHKIYRGIRLENIWEIQPDDYVVHSEFGIAKFLGIKKIFLGEKINEYLVLLFKDNAKLYVPVMEFNKVEKYVSLTTHPPSLASLDSKQWQKTKERIKESLKEFVTHLYFLYTRRKSLKGIKFQEDDELEKMLEETFEYEETEDQIKAINDVKKDLISGYPMDRIIVGDVGFGKTEVAIRAAFKAVLSGKQVLVLCPTTILAEQHYRTFVDRLEPFGVKVGVVTRLQNKKIIKQNMQKIKEGQLDIIIGTHILLNDEIEFFDLGLVIIDEEHKFGVKQKEKIRLKYREIESIQQNQIPHVLSLTATPIPRTLAFGLNGIKDISVIETPPEGRLPIETYILPYNEEIIISAISRELYRDGQVYYVVNQINFLEKKVNWLKNYFPFLEINFIHSKLPSKQIEEIMLKFLRKEIKILVTTTIIEAGLDIPTVNTMIVENAEKFGLSQLYQLRGRIGRRTTKAYCYLFYSTENLTSSAKKRLSALLEFSSLGSGYRLALRDLEIRGAGEILGTKQHGFVNEVGLSMYSKIIKEILSEVSKAPKIYDIFPKINIEIEAFIPDEYILDEETRILFYRKLLEAESLGDIEKVIEEMEDRFGVIKNKKFFIPLKNLLLLSKLRIFLKKNRVISIGSSKNKDIFEIIFEFLEEIDAKKIFKSWNKKFPLYKPTYDGYKNISIYMERFDIEEIFNMFGSL